MIIVDTNVLSEPLRPRPSRAVLAWLARRDADIALTTITVSELLYGAERLPEGRRREGLTEAIERLVEQAAGRLLGYDERAARAHASLRVAREAAGLTNPVEDGMIEAIALANGVPVATRNVAHFSGFGVAVVDPWADGD